MPTTASGPALTPATAAGSMFIGGEPMKPATKVFAGRAYTSSGGATCSMMPARITATRSASVIASS